MGEGLRGSGSQWWASALSRQGSVLLDLGTCTGHLSSELFWQRKDTRKLSNTKLCRSMQLFTSFWEYEF